MKQVIHRRKVRINGHPTIDPKYRKINVCQFSNDRMRDSQRNLIILEIVMVLMIIYCLLRIAWAQESVA